MRSEVPPNPPVASHSIVIFGDSTIDNKAWVNLEKSSAKPKLSVVGHLAGLLTTGHSLHDYSNDGFTTSDYLQGAYKDKAFDAGSSPLFPHEFFEPLREGTEQTRTAQSIILSIGGNNFHEFLVFLSRQDPSMRARIIKERFTSVMRTMCAEYIRIIRHIRELNSTAKIILLTQHYPAACQDTYKIYPLMVEIGRALNKGRNPSNPMDVIHEIMQETYGEILLEAYPFGPIVSADITSSLDPYNPINYVSQIELSNVGGEKVAQMLAHIILNRSQKSATTYRFLPEFFERYGTGTAETYIEKGIFQCWKAKHPDEFRKLVRYDHVSVLQLLIQDPAFDADVKLTADIDENRKLQFALIALEQTNPKLVTVANLRKLSTNPDLQNVLVTAHAYLNSGRFSLFRTHGSHGIAETCKMINAVMALETPTRPDFLEAMRAWLRTSNVHNSSRAHYAHRSEFFQTATTSTTATDTTVAYLDKPKEERRALLAAMLRP